VLEQYPNQVKVVFKNFPLRNHKFARPAALAALAANEQGKFWEFHDKIFENYNKLSDKKLQEIAVELQLDMDRYQADRKNQKVRASVAQDTRDGQTAGVRGTPTIFVNGRLLKNRSVQGFREVIDKLLLKSAQSPGSAPETGNTDSGKSGAEK
jgi:protein-disulfide isomerase